MENLVKALVEARSNLTAAKENEAAARTARTPFTTVYLRADKTRKIAVEAAAARAAQAYRAAQ